jgi:guanylate kinase
MEEDMVQHLAVLLENYKPSEETVKLVSSTPFVLLVGISGAGKDTIKHKLLETGDYHHIVSHTTRKPRMNHDVLEQDGVEYHFISLETAEQMLRNGEYVEAKMYSGNVYGTSAAEVQRAHDEHTIAITDIEVQGVAEYKAISQQVIAIFVVPPNYDEWQERLLNRYGSGKADPEDISKRMHTAVVELEEALTVPYYHFVVNDDIDRAVEVINKIAHNHDTFNEVDTQVREQAKALLADIRSKVA